MTLQKNRVFFSIVIPAHNETESIEKTCTSILAKFEECSVNDFEILVINDHSSDDTEEKLKLLAQKYPHLRYLNNDARPGFGLAVRKGLENFHGEAVCIVMADLSDSPEDIMNYYEKLKEGNECVFGSRFIKKSSVTDYPRFKLLINRLANWFIGLLFNIDHNDITNAFKCYRREVIEGVKPFLSHHFNLTVELPLKAIVRGYNYVTIPISWTNREKGTSHFKIKEMGSRYLFIVLYVFLEKLMSRGDYHRPAKKAKTP